MTVETLNGTQLSPEEVQFISNELGCSKEEVISGQIPTKPINQQYMPQYNPFQQMQQSPYDQRPQYNPYSTGYQNYGYYNQYGQQYYPQYIQGYTPLYQGQQYPQYQYMPMTNSYANGPVCDSQGNWYSNVNSYNNQMQNDYANQVQSAYIQMYQQQVLSDNPFGNYINLSMNYQPTPTTYFGYYASAPQINMYGFTMSPDDYAYYKNPESFLQNQKKIFEDISRGVLKTINPDLPDDLDIRQHYQKMLTPQIAEESQLEFNMFNFDPEVKRMEVNNTRSNYIIYNMERQEQYQKYVKSIKDKQMEQQMIENRKKTPENMTLSQFLESGGNLYREALIEDHKRRYARNLQNSYVQAHYNANVRPPLEDPNYYRAMMVNGQTDIGDISITLPSFLSRNYEERRRKFLSAIANSPSGDGLPF